MSSDCQSDTSGPLSSCSTRIGLTFIAQAACLSFISVVSLLTYVSYLTFENRHQTPPWKLIRGHLDLYLLGLLVSDLIQATGGIMDIKWIALAGVYEGSFCTAQGILQQFGDVGVALCSSAIAVHTFAELVFRWKEPASLTRPIVVLSLYLLFLTLIVGIGYALHHRKGYYGETTYWCWITSDFLKEGIGLEYLWFWTAALINLVLYIPAFLALKGIIIGERSGTWLRYRIRFTTPSEKEENRTAKDLLDRQARRMLLYPAVYAVTVLPVAFVRIPSLAHHGYMVPFPATVFCGVLFWSSGIFNVIVYTSTRPSILHPSAAMLDARPDAQRHPRTPRFFWTEDDRPDVQSISSTLRPRTAVAHPENELDEVRSSAGPQPDHNSDLGTRDIHHT